MLEGRQAIIDADPEAPIVDIDADAGSIQARNVVARLLAEEAAAEPARKRAQRSRRLRRSRS